MRSKAAMAPSSSWMRCRMIFAFTGALVGVCIFIVFSFQYHNWNTALWGLLSGVAACVTLVVHVLYQRGVWQVHAYRLRQLMLAGCFIQLAGVSGFITYLSLGIVQGQELTPYGEGFYLTCVWCFMTWKWGFALFYYSRCYRRQYVDVYSIKSRIHISCNEECDPLLSE